MLKRKVLWSILTVMVIIIVILNSPLLVSYRVYSFDNSSTNRTKTRCQSIDSIIILNNLMASLMRIYLPFVIMIVLNLLAIRALRRSRQRLDKYKINGLTKHGSNNSLPTGASKMSSIEYRFTVSNLAIDFIFLIFYLPLAVFIMFNIVTAINNTTETSATFNLFANLAQMFAFTFHLVDIIIFLAFNPKIRNDLFIAFGLKWFSIQNQSNNPAKS